MIAAKKKICQKCNRLTTLWSRGYCKSCFLAENPPKKIAKYSQKGLENKKKKTEKTKEMHEFFQKLWDSEPHYSEISGKWLGEENLSLFWHHIYPKFTYPQYAFDRDNIIRITGDEHAQVEAHPYWYKVINDRREKLKVKYGFAEKEEVVFRQPAGENMAKLKFNSDELKEIIKDIKLKNNLE